MSIRWDAVLARDVAREMEARLLGARLRAIRLDGVRREAVLYFRDATLSWFLHPTRGDFRIREAVEPPDDALRLPGKVRRVHAPADERLILFRVLPIRGRAQARDIVVELLGNQWNLVVVEGPDRILRHVLHTRSKGRELRVGARYEAPPPSTRLGRTGTLEVDEWRRITGGEDPSRSVVRELAWTGPLNRDAVLSEDGGFELWRVLADAEAPVEPCVLETAKGPEPYSRKLPGVPAEEAGSLAEAFERSAAAGAGGEAQESLFDPRLLRRLEDAARSARRRESKLRSEYEGLPDAESLRALGDLILARYHEVPPSATEAELTDFDGSTVRVELTPGDPPHANAGRYYDRAAKASRAAERLPGLIEDAHREAQEWDALLKQANEGTASPADVRSRLPDVQPGSRSASDEPTLPYRRYRSSGGLEIRVGRGSKRNDDLTFRHSSPGDIWLHARHTAGAHVILRWSGDGNPPARDLEEAGVLAALHSKARTSGSVPVDWTRRKHVRKPRKSPPGAVLPERVKTIFVEPDPALLDSLAD